jgi:hypothetical protein
VDVTSGLVLCAISSVVGVVLFARVRPNAAVSEPAPLPETSRRVVATPSPAAPPV